MQKTNNYNLNKPESTDPLRVADFNENADILDAALNTLNTVVPKIVTGTYTGNGAASRTISLGFTPKAVFVCNSRGATCYNGPTDALLICGGLALPDKTIQHSDGTPIALSITSEGFQVSFYNGTVFYNNTNSSNMTYHYVALS